MRFTVVNLGCKVNRVESDGIIAQLESWGFQQAAEQPDVAIVNTCTVTGEAEKKTRKAVRQVLRAYPKAQVLVTGCAAAIDSQEFLAMDERVSVVPKNQVADACKRMAGEAASAQPADVARTYEEFPTRVGEEFPTRVGVKVQDGCNNACTYCIVHVARGTAVSRPLSACVDEVRALAEAGVREVVLTGINLGSYNDQGRGIANLIGALREACPQVRVRISSIEPRDVDDDLIDLISQYEGGICRHMHLPLQSGSSRVLQQMARPYSAQDFLGLTRTLRERIPSIALSTDVIVGFPGETEDDFQQTLDLCRAAGFAKIHVFRYSKRAGTPAAQRPDQVPAQVIANRAKRLGQLADCLRREDARSRVGTTEEVVVESNGLGMSESYFSVHVGSAAPRGSMIRCTFTDVDKDGIFLV